MISGNNFIGSGGSLSNQFVSAKKETPFTRLAEALVRLRSAEKLVGALSEKLVGQAAPTEGEAAKPIGNGLFGTVEEMADAVSSLASEIIGHSERIERRL